MPHQTKYDSMPSWEEELDTAERAYKVRFPGHPIPDADSIHRSDLSLMYEALRTGVPFKNPPKGRFQGRIH